VLAVVALPPLHAGMRLRRDGTLLAEYSCRALRCETFKEGLLSSDSQSVVGGTGPRAGGAIGKDSGAWAEGLLSSPGAIRFASAASSSCCLLVSKAPRPSSADLRRVDKRLGPDVVEVLLDCPGTTVPCPERRAQTSASGSDLRLAHMEDSSGCG